MADVICLSHALVEHHLRVVRDKDTPPARFRQSVSAIGMLLGSEITRELETRPVEVETPLATVECRTICGSIAIVPILRAGLGLVDPLLALVPEAEVWHLGLYRDEASARPVPYYDKLPAGRPVDHAIVVDPMLATGGSIMLVLERLQHWGVRQIAVAAVIAAPEGIAAVRARFPEVTIVVAAIDDRLNDQAFIVPGLGDAGDRIFNTV